MILLLSCFVTNHRLAGVNRYNRFDIFKYMLYSYRNIPFSNIYLFIKLDDEFKNYEEDLIHFIYKNFSKLSAETINITFDRYTQQQQWIPVISNLMEKYGPNEPVWFSQNDDHVFVDFNMDILNEGIELLKNDPAIHKSIGYSHWPEALKVVGRHNPPELIGNYAKSTSISCVDSILIFNLQTLYTIFVIHQWRTDHNRIDSLVYEFTNQPYNDNFLNQILLIPLRELVRHFDGYDHVNMDRDACGPLELPSNTFIYTPETLRKKMTARHGSGWTSNNDFEIPQEWIDINLSLHAGVSHHTV